MAYRICHKEFSTIVRIERFAMWTLVSMLNAMEQKINLQWTTWIDVVVSVAPTFRKGTAGARESDLTVARVAQDINSHAQVQREGRVQASL